MSVHGLLTIALLLAAADVPPGQNRLLVPISVRTSPGAAVPAIEGAIVLEPLRQGEEQAAPGLLRTKTTAPGLFAVDGLPAGSWLVRTEFAGHWSEPKVATVSTGDVTVPVELWPTTIAKGRVTADEIGRPLNEIFVRFQALSPARQGEATTKGEIRCPIVSGAWSCEIPAGVFDLRLRVRGYVSEHRWGLEVPATTPLDLGLMKLRRGSSVVGRVDVVSAEGISARETPQVVVEPLTFDGSGPSTAMRSVSAIPNARGFFQAEGVSPGQYRVWARTRQGISAPQTIRVLQDVEVELHEPLLVVPPVQVRFELIPLRSPSGEPWRLRLLSGDGVGGRVFTVASGAPNDAGVWEQRLRAGNYRLMVESSNGRWLAREVSVESASPNLRIDIPTSELIGRVTLGDRPLESTVHFGGESGATSVRVTTDKDGFFEAVLPAREVWPEVTVEGATVKRTFVDVDVTRRQGEERVRVDFELPGTAVSGIVVDEKGDAVSRPIINIQSAGREPLAQLDAEADGTFALHGLPPGEAMLQAAGPSGESELLRVAVSPDEPREVRLVIRPYQYFRGRVVSAVGAVPGAQVAVRSTDAPTLVTMPATTNELGEFAAVLLPGAKQLDVTVQPPGFSFKMFHLIAESKPVEIPVDQAGGTLIVDLPQFDGLGPQPFLVHAGADIPLIAVRTTRFERGVRDGWVRLRTAMIERGHYSVCLASFAERPALRLGQLPPNRCLSGFVPPNGELSLQFAPD